MPIVNIPPQFKVTPEQFDRIVEYDRENRYELNSNRELVIMSPIGGTAGSKNFKLSQQLANWADRDGTGLGFDSSTMFVLPSGAKRSPDASWISLERWNQLTPKQQDGYPPIAPDFVIELVSQGDLVNQRYEDLQNKMLEYADNGVRWGWLIEPSSRCVEVYNSEGLWDTIYELRVIECESLLPGFLLDLEKIWQ